MGDRLSIHVGSNCHSYLYHILITIPESNFENEVGGKFQLELGSDICIEVLSMSPSNDVISSSDHREQHVVIRSVGFNSLQQPQNTFYVTTLQILPPRNPGLAK